MKTLNKLTRFIPRPKTNGFASMLTHMLTHRKQFQVINPIIQAITVLVMHMFFSIKLTANMFLHNVSMFINILFRANSKHPVSRFLVPARLIASLFAGGFITNRMSVFGSTASRAKYTMTLIKKYSFYSKRFITKRTLHNIVKPSLPAWYFSQYSPVIHLNIISQRSTV